MWNTPSAIKLSALPGLYSTDNIPVQDKVIHCHFFIGGCDWYVCEYDSIDTFFGFAILNGDALNAEWGLIGYSELKALKINGWQEVEWDQFWEAKPAREIKQINQAQNKLISGLRNVF